MLVQADQPAARSPSSQAASTSNGYRRNSPAPSGRSTPVVLTPTDAAPAQRVPARPRDLNTFLASDDEESEDEEESEEEESEEEEDGSEEESSEEEEEKPR